MKLVYFIFPIFILFSEPSFAVSSVSLSVLLVHADKYKGHEVEVFGFLNSLVSLRLYLTEGHARGVDVASSVNVLVSSSQDMELSHCLSDYVYIRGVLDLDSEKEMVLKEISRLVSSSKSIVCYEKLSEKKSEGLFKK